MLCFTSIGVLDTGFEVPIEVFDSDAEDAAPKAELSTEVIHAHIEAFLAQDPHCNAVWRFFDFVQARGVKPIEFTRNLKDIEIALRAAAEWTPDDDIAFAPSPPRNGPRPGAAGKILRKSKSGKPKDAAPAPRVAHPVVHDDDDSEQ